MAKLLPKLGALSGAPGPVVGTAVAITLVTTAAVAAMVISYPTPAAANLTLKAPPVVWSAGPDSSGNVFVASWTLSSNATYYTVTMKPVPEANVTWGNITSISNQDTQAWNVAVSATSVSGYSKIQSFRLEFYNYGTNALVGAMNLTAGSPSVDLGSMAAGANYYVKSNIQLATGTSASDLPAAVQISLSLT